MLLGIYLFTVAASFVSFFVYLYFEYKDKEDNSQYLDFKDFSLFLILCIFPIVNIWFTYIILSEYYYILIQKYLDIIPNFNFKINVTKIIKYLKK